MTEREGVILFVTGLVAILGCLMLTPLALELEMHGKIKKFRWMAATVFLCTAPFLWRVWLLAFGG